MGYNGNDLFKSSLDEEEEESIQHLLCDCPETYEGAQFTRFRNIEKS